MSIENIKELMDQFDPAALLPDLGTVLGKVELVTRIAVLIGPIVLLILGVLYFFMAPKEANHYFGYRCYHGMGSVEAWRFTQRLAGLVWMALGLVLTGLMVLVSSGFGRKEIVDVISSGITCMIWEIVLAAGSCLGINLLVMLRYNGKGERRDME